MMGARLLLPRLLLLLLLLLLHPSPSHPAVVDDELIVTFRRYDEADRQHAVLRAILLDLGEAAPELPVVAEKELRRAAATCAIAPGWRVVRRSNKACGLPTDFALLQVQGGGAGLGRRIRGALAGDARVRHVTSQRRLSRRRTLSASSDRDGAKSGGRAATADTFGPASEGLSGVEDEVNDDDGEGDLFDIDNPLTSRVRRFRPRPVPGEDPALFGDAFLEDDVADGRRRGGRRLLRTTKPGDDVARTLRAPEVWGRGITGAGVKVAIFDTGVKKPHAHFKNIDERSNWTTEDSLEDLLGHGTFSVGIVASTTDCLGFAPDASIHTYKVFTNDQISYTSWFLDAFNYAIHTGVDVLNLSIGGPDYLDEPFVEKVREATGSNVVVVSAIGNDGPLWGTLNNPADMPDVLGVGGITNDHDIARFSSRGMTTWELPRGIGRVKPDVVTYGYLRGCKIDGGCTHSSGTSVAGPVATGVVTLLASYLKNSGKHHFINPATMKQAVVESATRLVDPNKHTAAIYEQGAGNLNLIGALDVLKGYTPRPSLHPGVVDFTDCPYFWPYCEQPLYSGAMPVIVNATLVNGLGETGTIVNPPVWEPTLNGEHLDVQFTWSEVLWPWSGFVGLHLTVPAGSATWSGVVEGTVRVAVEAVPLNSALAEYAAAGGRGGVLRGEATMKLRVRVEAAPPRKKRLLFDTFHNIKYPPGFLPRDDLAETGDTLDWHADHPYTNYRAAYTALRRAGYFTELLGADFTCFDASQYAALVIVDPEDEYFPEERTKLVDDVQNKGLSLIVLADWYDLEVVKKVRFYDDNTRSWWDAVTGGSNLPAVNDLLEPFGIAFGSEVFTGTFTIGSRQATFASGNAIARAPVGSILYTANLKEESKQVLGRRWARKQVPVLALLDQSVVRAQAKAGSGAVAGTSGRIVVYGDSNCVDISHQRTPGEWILVDAMNFASDGTMPPAASNPVPLDEEHDDTRHGRNLPQRRPRAAGETQDILALHSRVLKSDRRPPGAVPGVPMDPRLGDCTDLRK